MIGFYCQKLRYIGGNERKNGIAEIRNLGIEEEGISRASRSVCDDE